MKRKKPFAANNASRLKLEAEGWTCGVVEQSVKTPTMTFKRDFMGFADLICFSPSRGVMAVQATGGASTSNLHQRVAKVKAEPRHAIALASGVRIQVHNWKGKGSNRICEVVEIMPVQEPNHSAE